MSEPVLHESTFTSVMDNALYIWLTIKLLITALIKPQRCHVCTWTEYLIGPLFPFKIPVLMFQSVHNSQKYISITEEPSSSHTHL